MLYPPLHFAEFNFGNLILNFFSLSFPLYSWTRSEFNFGNLKSYFFLLLVLGLDLNCAGYGIIFHFELHE